MTQTEDGNNGPQLVIVCYRPKDGKAEMLHQLMREHHAKLKSQDLVTDRIPVQKTELSSRFLNGNRPMQLQPLIQTLLF